MNNCFPPEMPLAELVEHYLVRSNNRKGGQPSGELWQSRCKKFVRLLGEYLDRTPLVSDLDAAAQATFLNGATKRSALAEVSSALCRYVGTVHDGRRGKFLRPLSNAPGTLWHLCQSRYFPTNVRIRSDATIAHYRMSLCDLKEAIGHDPTPDDLTDENIARMMKAAIDRGLSMESVNERRNKLRALWEWCARKRIVQEFPTIQRVKAPRRIPRAWSIAQLNQLVASCRQRQGEIVPGMLAGDWWVALTFVQWDSSERISALLSARWDHLELDSGALLLPAEIRKGGDSDALYPLSAGSLTMLARLKPANQELIFPWPWCMGTFYDDYTAILKAAGLPHDRKSKTHRMRRSVASHLQAAGHDACAALGHSSPQVTRDSYLDPTICGQVKPSEVLPKLLMADEPRRLGQGGVV